MSPKFDFIINLLVNSYGRQYFDDRAELTSIVRAWKLKLQL